MSSHLTCVLTTIQPPTASVHQLARALAAHDADLIVIGDKKGPAHFDLPAARFYSLADQTTLHFALAKLLPIGHYTRKNLGYLLAIANRATCIYETDDDNAPLDRWTPRSRQITAHAVGGDGWFNVYDHFGSRISDRELLMETQSSISNSPSAIGTGQLWPRGFPLDLLRNPASTDRERLGPLATLDAPIQQGLADGSPDVDAVWRLILDRDVRFDSGAPSLVLSAGAWCPFNSQSTWWFGPAHPLLYLPSRCTFRMTDIWRSLIAQRCLWEIGAGVAFHGPEVFQERNPHDLMRDFADEVPGYLQNDQIRKRLEAVSLVPGEGNVGANLLRCYEALIEAKFFPGEERELVQAWVKDVETLTQ